MKGRLACAVLVLASSGLMNGSRVSAEDAQVPAAVYARAEAVIPQHIGKLIYGTSVRPQWIGATSRFQFEKRTPRGREYWVVDAVAGTMQPLFDPDAMIKALAAATGKAVDRKKFRLTEVEVDAGTGTLRFQQDGKGWHYDPKSTALTAYSAPADKGLVSPDGAWRAFVRDGNLFVVAVNDGREKQLTTDGAVDAPYATPVMDPKTMIAQGTQRPVVEPALSWSPDSRRIATFHLSQEGARRLAIVQSTPPDGDNPRMFEYVYPLPGDTAVPLAKGVFFEVETGKRVDMALAGEPMLYYLAPEFTWTADSKAVLERVTERGYKALQLYRVDAATGASSLLSEDRSDTYVDFWSHFWSYDDKSDTVYWTADKTGFLQTYAIDARTGARRQITSGDWRVASVAGIDQSAGKLLIVGTGREAGRDPYLRHLYAVPKKGGALQLLTPEPLDHDVSVSPRRALLRRQHVADQCADEIRPASLQRRAHRPGAGPCRHHCLHRGRLSIARTLRGAGADGETPIYGAIFKPADFDPGKRYPIIEEMYTGPQIVSMTAKSFEAGLMSRGQNSLAQLGVIALTIDGRGVAGRSRAFQQPSYKNLHAVGLDDHIAGIRALAAKNPWMDISRVGIHGYSAGGYDVVKAMTRAARLLQGRPLGVRRPGQPARQGLVERAMDGRPARAAVRCQLEHHVGVEADGQAVRGARRARRERAARQLPAAGRCADEGQQGFRAADRAECLSSRRGSSLFSPAALGFLRQGVAWKDAAVRLSNGALRMNAGFLRLMWVVLLIPAAVVAQDAGPQSRPIYNRDQWLPRSVPTSDDGLRIPVPADFNAPKGSFVLVGGRLFDGTGAPARPATIVVQGKTITAVLNPGERNWPADAVVYDISGKTVMPGLIDLHTHLTFLDVDDMSIYSNGNTSGAESVMRGLRRMAIHLQSGVTSVRDVASHGDAPFVLKRLQASGEIQGPRIFTAGQLITRPAGMALCTRSPPDYPEVAQRQSQCHGPHCLRPR